MLSYGFAIIIKYQNHILSVNKQMARLWPTDMKQLLLTALLFCFASTGFAQTNLISYDDLSYLLHNNINKADTFFTAKGHTLIKKDEKKNLRN